MTRSGTGSIGQSRDPRIQIRIRIKISWIRNTDLLYIKVFKGKVGKKCAWNLGLFWSKTQFYELYSFFYLKGGAKIYLVSNPKI